MSSIELKWAAMHNTNQILASKSARFTLHLHHKLHFKWMGPPHARRWPGQPADRAGPLARHGRAADS